MLLSVFALMACPLLALLYDTHSGVPGSSRSRFLPYWPWRYSSSTVEVSTSSLSCITLRLCSGTSALLVHLSCRRSSHPANVSLPARVLVARERALQPGWHNRAGPA